MTEREKEALASSAPNPHYLDIDGEGPSPTTSHPNYIAAVPDWFWSEEDPRAPFGTDDGHDTFSALQTYFADGGRDRDVPGFVARLISGWDLVPDAMWDGSTVAVLAWLDADTVHARFLHGQIDVYVAAACGQFKISGGIHPSLRSSAERAVTLMELALVPWAQKTFGSETDWYDEKVAATRAVIAAAPEHPEET